MNELLKEQPHYQEVVSPYIGGAEINVLPSLTLTRYVIGFGRLPLEECRLRYAKLVDIVEAKVKPDRDSRPKNPQSEGLARRWWQWHTDRPTLKEASEGIDRVLVISRISSSFAFTFLPKKVVVNEKIVVFPFQTASALCVLQSRIHEIWTRFFSSTLKDDLQYTPSICFETFPFPENWESDRTLESIGKQYYEFRAELMVRNNQGLTETYNRFHDPNEIDPDILQLRQLHDECDRAVLAAYGWSDIAPQCEFLLDYEDDAEEESGKRQRKKPWRYRWNEATHDEVLARLLDLNQKRHEQEILGGASAQKSGKPKKGRARSSSQPTLPGLN